MKHNLVSEAYELTKKDFSINTYCMIAKLKVTASFNIPIWLWVSTLSNLTSSIRCLSSWSVRNDGLYTPSVLVLPVPKEGKENC